MTKLIFDGTVFNHHKFALYVTDLTFQQTNRSSGNHEESQFWYIAKHKLYWFKVEVSVLPNSLSIDATKHSRGRVSYIEIFKQNVEFHTGATKKYPKKLSLQTLEIYPIPIHPTGVY